MGEQCRIRKYFCHTGRNIQHGALKPAREIGNLPSVDGKVGGMGIIEFIERFETLSQANMWSDTLKLARFQASVTGDPYTILKSLPTDNRSEAEIFENWKASLLKNFGLSNEAAFNNLCDEKFNSGSDQSVSMYSNMITQLVKTSFPD